MASFDVYFDSSGEGSTMSIELSCFFARAICRIHEELMCLTDYCLFPLVDCCLSWAMLPGEYISMCIQKDISNPSNPLFLDRFTYRYHSSHADKGLSMHSSNQSSRSSRKNQMSQTAQNTQRASRSTRTSPPLPSTCSLLQRQNL